jgi:serine/threonine protein kinase
MSDVEQFHYPPDANTYVLHPCLVYAVGGIQHVREDSDGKRRRARRFTPPERKGLSPAPAAEPRRGNGGNGGTKVLPERAPTGTRSAARTADYTVGDVIDDRFEILEKLGQGGFSKVYRVRDDVEDKDRALKLFATAAGQEAVRREIGALREIRHPNVVEVFWAGRTSAGDWYLITEFIAGESLEEFVTGGRNLRDREALDVALDLLAALAAFHPDAEGKGLIHRDIKPRNVMLTRTGAKLLDFNIASRVGDIVHTQSGTPPYQPPDADLIHWDVSTDLFAVGVLLYQLLCNGSHPYPDALPVIDGPVTDPRTIRADLGPDLAEFLIKACAPASRDRFATAAEMQLALRNIRDCL